MRAQLGWTRQTDSHSCGPLSIAAALLLLQVISPTEGTFASWRIDSWRKIESPLSQTTFRAAPPAALELAKCSDWRDWIRAAFGLIRKHSQNIYLAMRRKIRQQMLQMPPEHAQKDTM